MFGEIHGRVLFIAAAKDMRESISFESEFPGTEPAFRVGVRRTAYAFCLYAVVYTFGKAGVFYKAGAFAGIVG